MRRTRVKEEAHIREEGDGRGKEKEEKGLGKKERFEGKD